MEIIVNFKYLFWDISFVSCGRVHDIDSYFNLHRRCYYWRLQMFFACLVFIVCGFCPHTVLWISIVLAVERSICLSWSCMVLEWLNLSSEFFYSLISPTFKFSVTNQYYKISTWSSLKEAWNPSVVWKFEYLLNYLPCLTKLRSIDSAVRPEIHIVQLSIGSHLCISHGNWKYEWIPNISFHFQFAVLLQWLLAYHVGYWVTYLVF